MGTLGNCGRGEGKLWPGLRPGQPRGHLGGLVSTFAGYHLYYPNRRQPSAAFSVLVEALLYRGQ
ncbi:hypothetical protein PMI09_00278 [Rhizobium sp. CF122]|nr:hypothetical protein PMI09_00278 [Rhizobium sp. CF122]